MKLITFAIPCYNSANYMDKCILSLLKAGEDAEILVVNDGSTKDNTAEIADRYEKEYPTIVKAIHKENGGHGDAVNYGLKNATGKYFKVVDSDDWVDESALNKIMEALRSFEGKEECPDAVISNYVYEKVYKNERRVVKFENFPEGRLFDFEETKPFKTGQFMSMHSMIYRTELLRSINFELPKHTFYVDNLVVYVPLPYVMKYYYVNVDFYRYFIGRADQSVAIKNQLARSDQMIRVGEILIASHDINKLKETRPKLYKYMLDYVLIMTVLNSIFLIKKGGKEAIAQKRAFWNYLKEKDPVSYKKCRKRFTGITYYNCWFTHWICKVIYFFAVKVLKTN